MPATRKVALLEYVFHYTILAVVLTLVQCWRRMLSVQLSGIITRNARPWVNKKVGL
jgi:hypothetical protein